MILAINCGDDTDCTGATVGALLGIMKGTAGIPEDWRQYIGDNIATIAIIRGTGYFPSTCAQLTQCVMNLIPTANRTDNWSVIRGETKMELTDGPDDFSEVTPESFLGSAFVDHMFQRSHYSYTVSNCYATVLVEYETEPVITPGGSLKAASRLFRKRWRTKTLSASLGNEGTDQSVPLFPRGKKRAWSANWLQALPGSPSWTRTNDPAVNSRMLYRLSY